MSSGIPTVETMDDGRRGLAYRKISIETLLGQQRKQQDDTVERTVTDTLQLGMVDAVEDAVTEVERQYPAEKDQ